MKMKKVAGLGLAAVAAVGFSVASTSALAAFGGDKNVSCYGVNACKGKSSCKAGKNSCKGTNSCKGQGVVKVSKEACDQIGGSTEDPNADQD